MQTFLPYPDFARSAACLDRLRLGKQRVEVLQILRALLVPGSGWASHPAVKMWRGHEGSLCVYGSYVCLEWRNRRYKDSCEGKMQQLFDLLLPPQSCYNSPPWLGDPAFHASHRSNLLRKDPVFYGQYGWTEPPDLEYIWPKA